jgi:signal transduction histidine kinase/BarA-like signal transduction histidine kinase
MAMDVKSARILFVEDDEDDYILTVDQLKKLENYNFEIDWVTSRDQALVQLKRNVHDICLLDYQLGAYTGLDVLNQANQLGSYVPIIMLTGQPNDTLDELALNAGAADFLVKGDVTNARFARAIRYAISRVEIQKARQRSIDAETESRSKDRFIAHLSHELRTPLTSILGYAELLLNSDKANDVQKELSAILNNGKHLLSLLNDMLDLSKIAAGKLLLKPEPIELSSFIADVLTLMQIPASQKGLSLNYAGSRTAPKMVFADPTRLRQVIINLIFNAIKFTEIGGVTLKVHYDPDNHSEQIQFIISDTGVGISQTEIETIFIPFQQIEDVTLKSEQGAGLGLAISNELIRRMDGQISVKSKLGKGSDFIVTLPLATQYRYDIEPLIVSISEVVNKTDFVPLHGKVLIVDDVADIRQLVGDISRTFGLQVRFANNGKQAAEYIADNSETLDLVVMDIHMPIMDGRQAIVEIRNAGYDKPVFALTAANMKGVSAELKDLGFTGVISKPVQQDELYDAYDSILSAKKVKPNRTKQSATELVSTHVLVVEDDRDAAELIVLLLDSMKIKAEAVFSYQACLQKINGNGTFTHVLLDKNLPDGNGVELAKYIHSELSSKTQIILVSGEEINLTELRQSGITQSLLKPISVEQLRSVFTKSLV